MKRLLALVAALLLVPCVSLAQEHKPQKIVIFPFKMVTPGTADSYSNEVAAVLGADFTREGDTETISGQPFVSAVQERK